MAGILLIVSGPSGVGKTTLIRAFLEAHPSFAFAVSHTTRPPRQREEDGADYYFVDDAQFDRMIAEGAFVEWAEVHDHRYGTSRAEVERLLRDGKDVVFEVDFQGGRALMRHYRNATSVFILPPSMAELRRRLLRRGSEGSDELGLRLHNARMELAAALDYQFLVVNRDVSECIATLGRIVEVERLRSRLMEPTLKGLLAEPID